MKKDIYVKINTCFNCYEIGGHVTKDCQNPSCTKCSKCSQLHSHIDCKSSPEEFKCLNCKQNHHTLSMSCPIRKKFLSNRRKEILEQNLNSRPSYVQHVTKQSVIKKPLLPTPQFTSALAAQHKNASVRTQKYEEHSVRLKMQLTSNHISTKRVNTFFIT